MKSIYTTLFCFLSIWSVANAQTANLSGQIFLNSDSVTVLSSVVVVLRNDAGDALETTETAEFGRYEFSNLATGETYEIQPIREGDDLNGISTFDMVLIQQHILGRNEFDRPLQLIAADLSNSQTVSTLDMVQMRQLILGITDELPNERASWTFVRSTITFANPNNPFDGIANNDFTINLTEDVSDFNFTGVKIGDVNGSAAP
ncbi:MAG: hypothetical protein AB8G22_08510 [Saprospiraceae bacterium]